MPVQIKRTLPGSAATTEELGAYLDHLPLFAESFRGTGDTDRQVLQKAIDALVAQAAGVLHLEPGRVYNLGASAASTLILDLAGVRNAVIEGNHATLRWETTGEIVSNMLRLYDFENVTIRNLHGTDDGYTGEVVNGEVPGARMVVADTGANKRATGLTLENVTATKMAGYLVTQGTPSNRVSNIRLLGTCRSDDVFYPLSFKDNGDDVAGSLTITDPARAYFPYGVTGHDLALRIVSTGNGPGADSCCLIKRYDRNTTNIRLRLSLAKTLDNMGNIVVLEHQNDSGAASIIDGIDLSIHVEEGTTDTSFATRLLLRSYTAAGVENTGNNSDAGFGHWTKNVRIGGQLGLSAEPHIVAHYVPAIAGIIALDPGLFGLSSTKTIDAPGFLVKTAPDRYLFEKFGSLTTSPLAIPVPDMHVLRGAFRITTYAEPLSANTLGTSLKAHVFEDFVAIYATNPGGANNVGIVTGSPGARREVAFNSSALTLSYGVGTDHFLMTFAGSDYNVSTAYARVELEALSRPLKR